MARIRSIKPEFWIDEDLAREVPDRDARMLYVGLWNQADEHARLRSDATWIKGQVFPYDEDLTPEVIDKLIDMLVDAGRAVRYRIRSSAYLFLPKLSEHQRLEPNKVPSRLPAPPADLQEQRSEKLPDKSAPRANKLPLKQVAGSREHVASGRQQARERGAAQTTQRGADEPPPDTEPGQAEQILAGWIGSLKKKPLTRIVNDVGKHIRAALEDGQDPADIAEALTLWQRRGNLGPAVLPSLIHQVANAPPPGSGLALPDTRASPQRPSTTDARVRAGAAMTAELEALQAKEARQ